jgi:LCP family protein required for cell wall assembly
MMKKGRRSLLGKIVFVLLIVVLGTLVALSDDLVLSIKPPTGNPTLESLKNNPAQSRTTNSPAAGNEASINSPCAEPLVSGVPSSEKPLPDTEQTTDIGIDSHPGSSAVPSPDAVSDEIYYFLFAGFDAAHANTDTILLAGFNMSKKSLHLLSIPRDTLTGSDRLNKKINAAWQQGGIIQLENEVAELTGIDVNRYIMTSHEGMEKMMEAAGGISFNTDGDIGCISMQQELAKAIAAQPRLPADTASLSRLAILAMEHFETDLTMGEILWLSDALNTVSPEDVHFYTLPGQCVMMDGTSYWIPDKEAIASLIQ